MIIIDSFNFDVDDIIAAGETRLFSFNHTESQEETDTVGDLLINLQVFDSTGKFYNFSTNSFTSGMTEFNENLKVKLNDVISIVFPAASSVTYGVLAFVTPMSGIEFSKAASKDKYIFKTSVNQIANTTLTITPATENTNTYKSFTTITRVATPVADAETKTFSFTIENVENDGNGFGIIPTTSDLISGIPLLDSDFYFQTTDTVNVVSPKTDTVDGAVSSSTAVTLDTSYVTTGIAVGDFVYGSGVTNGTTVSAVNVGSNVKNITLSAAMSISDGVTLTFVTPSNQVVVDDLTDIVSGMTITGVDSCSLSGTPAIIGVGFDDQTVDAKLTGYSTKTLFLSTDQAFADGTTLTFRANGSQNIEKAIGAKISTSNLRAVATPLTKTVRAAVSNSTTITLNGTYGIAKTATIKGLDVNNSTSNAIQSVSASSSAGSAVVQVNQTLTLGTVLSFNGCNRIITLTGNVEILKQPTSNRTININIDNFLTPGVGS